MKEKTLVIAGIGRVDYALSAAVVVRQLGLDNTDIFCTSTARLAVHMAEYAAQKNPPNKIVIMGIGLHQSPAELLKAVRKLREKNSSVTWISKIPLPEGMPEETAEAIEIVCREDVPLYQVAAERFGGEFPAFAEIEKAGAEAEAKASRARASGGSESRARADFINACYYHYRNFQDKEPALWRAVTGKAHGVLTKSASSQRTFAPVTAKSAERARSSTTCGRESRLSARMTSRAC